MCITVNAWMNLANLNLHLIDLYMFILADMFRDARGGGCCLHAKEN